MTIQCVVAVRARVIRHARSRRLPGCRSSRRRLPNRGWRLVGAVLALSCLPGAGLAQGLGDKSGDLDALPLVPAGFRIQFAAREPLVRNPCALAFDADGQMFVGMGPQYRSPQPETPGDSVYRMVDRDHDGVFETRELFATGLNCIQSLSWNGRQLWVANAPDLTVVEDQDGDGTADRYTRLYTDLGNLEHGLHGLTWGPDGRLYMSKGNSKGLTQPGRVAPAAFRELWDVSAPDGTPDIPEPRVFTAETYRRNYHDPSDDWGRQGGVLVCDADGRNLEILSRGFRNPWDIAFDHGFDFQGTDNDQNEGDRVFMPFAGAHFGWGHSWSPHWTGTGHLPTAPITGPVFHGSGTGITYCDSPNFPVEYRGVWLFNDWLRRTTLMYRPRWDGALLQPDGADWIEFVKPGQSLFKPTDLEVGPDGALYILGWGREYGVQWNAAGEQINEGRIFRVTAVDSGEPETSAGDSSSRKSPRQFADFLSAASPRELVHAFRSPLNARRQAVAEELILRGQKVVQPLLQLTEDTSLSAVEQTWMLWTLGRIAAAGAGDSQRERDPDGDSDFRRPILATLSRLAGTPETERLNQRIQAIRVLADVARRLPQQVRFDELVPVAVLSDSEPRVRLAGVLALRTARARERLPELRNLLASETDRVVFYAGWQTLRTLAGQAERRRFLSSSQAGVRLAALLSLAEERALEGVDVGQLLDDVDPRVREIAAMWLSRANGNPLLDVHPPPGTFDGEVRVQIVPGIKPAELRFTIDGSEPTRQSPRWPGSQVFRESTVLRVALFAGSQRVGPPAVLSYERVAADETARREGVLSPTSSSGHSLPLIVGGLQVGRPVFSDRAYQFTDVPAELQGAHLLQTANADAGSGGDRFLTFTLAVPMTVLIGHDERISEKPEWLLSPGASFSPTDWLVTTQDTTYRLYEREAAAGTVQLGGNATDGTDSGKSNYLIILRSAGLPRLNRPTTAVDALAALADADIDRGRALFFSTAGAGCARCHRADSSGLGFGPDLGHLTRQTDAGAIVRSMLDPSAEIKEGFAMQIVVTADGRSYAGLLREETDVAVRLIQPDGRLISIPTREIEERVSQRVSPMPVFSEVLTARQVADITAWLMHRPEAASPSTQSGGEFSFQQHDDRLEWKLNGRPVGTYVFRHAELTRPAWVHLRSPSGVQLTRNFPPRQPEDDGALDHRLMHPGLWISFGYLAGEDYWRLQSTTRHVRFAEAPRVEGERASFAVHNRYLRGQGPSAVCDEITRYSLQSLPQGVLMLVRSEFWSDTHDFEFGDQEESGLAFRMESRLRVDAGRARILNSAGDVNGTACWGKTADWIDYSGVVDQRRVGIMVVPDAGNPRQSWMHTRDYGVVAVNPFPRQPRERRQPYVTTRVRQGERFRLGWAVWLHEQAATEEFRAADAYRIAARELLAARQDVDNIEGGQKPKKDRQ